MSDQENFLTRWSQRKLKRADAIADKAEAAEQPTPQGEATNQAVAEGSAQLPAPEFDLTKLPSLESIGANSDIRAFLQPGVPSSLRLAALRRAWASDPAIRDFKGLAELDWDFTAPDSMAGFGDLGPDVDVKKLVAEIFRDAVPEAESRPETSAPTPAPDQPARLPDQSDTTAGVPAAGEPAAAERQQVAALKSDPLLQREENIATQHIDPNESSAGIKPRRHGSATPQ
jgi:hypothetical protein